MPPWIWLPCSEEKEEEYDPLSTIGMFLALMLGLVIVMSIYVGLSWRYILLPKRYRDCEICDDGLSFDTSEKYKKHGRKASCTRGPRFTMPSSKKNCRKNAKRRAKRNKIIKRLNRSNHV